MFRVQSKHCFARYQTRLKILLRPKAPKILQELLSNSKELPSPRPTKLLKKSKRFQKIPKRFQKIPKDSNRLQKIPKDSIRFQKIPKDSKRFQKIAKESKRIQKIQKNSSANNICHSKSLLELKKLMSPSPTPPPEESKTKRRPRCLGA